MSRPQLRKENLIPDVLYPWRTKTAGLGRVKRDWIIPPIRVSENSKQVPEYLVQVIITDNKMEREAKVRRKLTHIQHHTRQFYVSIRFFMMHLLFVSCSCKVQGVKKFMFILQYISEKCTGNKILFPIKTVYFWRKFFISNSGGYKRLIFKIYHHKICDFLMYNFFLCPAPGRVCADSCWNRWVLMSWNFAGGLLLTNAWVAVWFERYCRL